MSSGIPFKISSALKNLIGKELITDEFVAVFELVKNSFDADATKVELIFENQTNSEKGKIIIRDNGKGMSKNDLLDKWLWVAYSAKKDGSENEDYRNRIKSNRYFAGAKGVGRFSCDRLGRQLILTTTKNERNSQTEILSVNWEDFEQDPKKEFMNVNVQHETVKRADINGTTLEIVGLRDAWDREKLLRLKKSLAKLINPNQGNDAGNFRIEVIAESELDEDNNVTIDYDKVNGPVSNTIFENLKIKTTSITVEISEFGEHITTTLQDRGDRIYTLLEKNPFSDTLKNIRFHLFQLNRSAKAAFTKAMGIEPIKYGSVFMYKNGFRVYPFGEPGEDLLLIDRRKTQGYNRFLGNRDLIGRIEINGIQPELQETTSRDGGFVKTTTYNELLNFFEDYVLVRLENYVVNIIKWGDEKIDKETGELVHPELWAKDVKIQILELITGFIKSENVISIDYDKNFLDIIENKQDKSVDKIIKNISKIAANSNNPAIIKEAEKIGKVVNEVRNENKLLVGENDALKKEKKKADEKLEYTIEQNLFLSDSVKADTKEFKSLLHHTEKSTYWINKYLENLIRLLDQNAPKEKINEIISLISLENQKIYSFTKYHKSTNFNTFVDKIEQDIVSFINQYANNVCKYYAEYEKMNITINTPHGLSLKKNFAPIDVTIIIDNLLNNSKKALANHVSFDWDSGQDKEVVLRVRDNGGGIKESVINNIFDFHFSTTKGSGLGLYHVKKVIQNMNAEISVNPLKKGVEFIITFKM